MPPHLKSCYYAHAGIICKTGLGSEHAARLSCLDKIQCKSDALFKCFCVRAAAERHHPACRRVYFGGSENSLLCVENEDGWGHKLVLRSETYAASLIGRNRLMWMMMAYFCFCLAASCLFP